MNEQVFPYLQPIVETATGLICGYEVLARRLNPQGEVESAADIFSDITIPVEQRIAIELSVREQAFVMMNNLPHETFLSFNVSPYWPEALETLDTTPTLEMIARCQVDPKRLVFEITEQDGQQDMLTSVVQRYRQKGIRIAIDNFGAGFSQLDGITYLRPDIIKLDMQLLKQKPNESHRLSIVQMLGEMASKLGCKVLCDGIETDDEYYQALSCHTAYTQGFLFAPAQAQPLAVDTMKPQISELLSHYRDMAIEVTSRNHWRADKVKAELLALREVLKVTASDEDLPHFIAADHLLRFYICDKQGNQISANYENTEKGWVRDEENLGHNWSWRPYFFQLLGSSDTRNRVVFSEIYQDIHNGQRVQTAVLVIDDQRILLADLLDNQKDAGVMTQFGGMPNSWIPELN